MTTILVTGATGFIGSRVLASLRTSDFRIIAAARRPPPDALRPFADQWIEADLIDGGAAIIRRERPSHVLHLAWDARHGLYWTSRENLLWVASTARMIEAFAENGGQRFVMAGSCAEYDWTWRGGDFDEHVTPLAPATLYGAAKRAAGELLLAAGNTIGFSAAIGRVFFCYGQGEHQERLVSYVCGQIARGKEALVSSGVQVRDFLHVDDVATGLVALALSRVEGPINIASGEGKSLANIVDTIGRMGRAPHLVKLGARADRPEDPPRIVGNSARLRTTGWVPKITLEDGVQRLIEGLRST